MIVLTWNLYHGRSVPESRGALLGAFAQRLAAWDWDVALLQEVPLWWPPALGRAAGASARMAPTSRNWLLAVRRAIAVRNPGLVKSGGGGCNAILVRRQAIHEHCVRTLRLWPERRVAHGVRLSGGAWITNLHAQAHVEARARADLATAAAETAAWASGAPTVLGGDLNLRAPIDLPGYSAVADHSVDHVLVRGFEATGPARLLESAPLSDHRALVVEVVPA